MSDERRDFYAYHSAIMEPWDGPASIAFTDGTVIGAVLDRNGLRPSRYWVTDDGLVVMASEVGVLDIDPATRRHQGPAAARPHVPGRHRARAASSTTRSSRPTSPPPSRTASGCATACCGSRTCPSATCSPRSTRRSSSASAPSATPPRNSRSSSAPMARIGYEPIGSMGTDTPIAVLSQRSRLLFDYFSQLFAQVTNPPLDAIREELVTSMAGTIGPEANLLEPGPGVVPADRAAEAGAVQRGPRQDPLRQRGRRAPRLRAVRDRRALPGRRGRRRACAAPSTRCAPRSAPPSPTARGSSCSRTATPTPNWHRSRRCC